MAIAGGSGGLGRVITEAIIAAGEHEVFVISRSVSKMTLREVASANLGLYTDSMPISDKEQSYYLNTPYR